VSHNSDLLPLDDLKATPCYEVPPLLLKNANIGRNYWTVNIGAIPTHLAYRGELAALIERLPSDAGAGRGAIFWGHHETGKTSCAVICLREIMSRGGGPTYFVNALSLRYIAAHRTTETTPEGMLVWNMITRCPFLVLDDLGAESRSVEFGQPADTRVVEEVVRTRYDNLLVTYVTTNKVEELTATAGLYAGIATILADPSRFDHIEVAGKAWRQGR